MVVKLQLIEYCKWGNKKEGMDTGFGIDAIEKIKQEQYNGKIYDNDRGIGGDASITFDVRIWNQIFEKSQNDIIVASKNGWIV